MRGNAGANGSIGRSGCSSGSGKWGSSGGTREDCQTLGITDPPPNQLLTKAIKPLASNTRWDYAIAKAAPDMKAVETDLGHPISGVDDALAATSIAKKAIWNQYAEKLNAAKQAFPNAPSMATIDGNPDRGRNDDQH